MYVCDVRSGCVGVYKSPVRDCLAQVDCVYFRSGMYNGMYWTLPDGYVREARRICALLNSKCFVLRAAGRLLAATKRGAK